MTLNFFFDIDGTLLPFGKGVRPSAVEAFHKARAKGHRMFLCSGRSLAELDPKLNVLEFDGGVFSGGGTVVLGDKTLFRRRFTPEEKAYSINYLKANGFMPMSQTDVGTYLNQEAMDFFDASLMHYQGTTLDVPNVVIAEEIPEELEINKILVFAPNHDAMRLRTELADRFDLVDNTVGLPQTLACEVVIKGMTKATGIETMLDYLGVGPECSVGIGDGANDIEMVEFCGLGIAMGNASEDLKAVADYMTGDCNEDGIAEAISYALDEYLNNLKDFD